MKNFLKLENISLFGNFLVTSIVLYYGVVPGQKEAAFFISCFALLILINTRLVYLVIKKRLRDLAKFSASDKLSLTGNALFAVAAASFLAKAPVHFFVALLLGSFILGFMALLINIFGSRY